jgi:hypothetical protein
MPQKSVKPHQEPEDRMTTELMYSWEALKMEDVGPGDADVCTKSGRHTTVKINVTKPAVELQAHRLRVHVVYDVIEGRKDYTHLQMSSDILIPLPSDWKNVSVKGVADFNARTVIYGKNHRWNSFNVNSVNWIQTLEAKIDGPGDDNEGNAGLRISFAIPVSYDLAA